MYILKGVSEKHGADTFIPPKGEIIMKKRVLALLMACFMLVSAVPTQAFALTTDELGNEVYEVGDSLWLADGVTPEAAVVSDAEWVKTETTKEETEQTCGLTEHTHSAECEAVEYSCGLEEAAAHTHGAECSGTALTCGLEETEGHSHSELCYTDGNLTCGLEEAEAHAHTEECYTQLVCALEETEGHTHSEECGAVISYVCGSEAHIHDEVCDTVTTLVLWMVMATEDEGEPVAQPEVSTYTVTVTTPGSGYYTLYDPATKYYQTVSAVRSGSGYNRTYQATFTDVPEGTYIIASGKSGGGFGGGSVYVDSITVSGDVSYTMSTSSQSFSNLSLDQQTAVSISIYSGKSTFDHVDIRVAGSFTVDGVEHTIDLQNTSIVVVDPGKENITGSFAQNEDEDYEWRTTGTSVSKNAVIHVTFDLYIDGNLTTAGYTVDFSGFWDFVEAIRICDMQQGLDFRIVEAIVSQRYNVSYTWTGLPEGLATLPAGTTGLLATTEYTVNTSYPQGLEIYDTANGMVYTFHGWYQWTDEANNITALDPAAPGIITMPPSDIVIHGLWTSEPMAEADGTITLTKSFSGLPADAYPSNYFIRVAYTVNGTAHQVDVDFSQFTKQSDGTFTYAFPVADEGTYVITEMNYAYAGYNNTAAVTPALTAETTSSVAATATDGTSITLDVILPAVQEETVLEIGSVNFTNAYTQKTGTADVYPDLQLRKFDDDGSAKVLAGVEFTLYADAALENAVGTYTTGEFGYVNFHDLQPGTYYLTETAALDNYHADSTVYTIVVAEDAAQGYTEYDAVSDTYITYTVYDVNVLVGEDAYEGFDAANNRMLVYNTRIKGSISLVKDFNIVDDEGNAVSADTEAELLAGLTIRAHIHGPVAMTTTEGVTTVSDWGTEYVVELKDGQWVYSQGSLELGTYLIHEVYTHLNGYEWTGATIGYPGVDITLDDATVQKYAVVELTPANAVHGISMEIVNNYEQWDNAHFVIHKVDGSGSHLAGATFQLYYDEACTQTVNAADGVTVSATTGTDGYARFYGFAADTDGSEVVYYLKETAAPTGFVADTTVYKVVAYIEGGTNQVKIMTLEGTQVDVNDTLEWVNEPITGDLTIKKTFTGDLTDYPVINITITGPNGYVKYLELNGIADSEGETSAWTAVLEDLVYGQYTISESSAAVPGYDWSVTGNDQTVDIATHGQTSEITITNDYQKNEETIHNPASFYIYKADAASHEPLAGAVFTLFMDEDCTVPVKAEDVPAGFTITAETGANGQAIFSGLWIDTTDATATRTYWLKETQAPHGYHLEENAVWKVVIKEKDDTVTVQVNLEKNWFENIYDWVVDQFTGTVNGSSYSAGVLTVHNTKILGQISLSKVFVDDAGNALPAAALADAEIIAHVHGPYTGAELAQIEDGTLEISDATDADRLHLNAANGFVDAKDGLTVGYYLIHEAYVHVHGYDFVKASYDAADIITVGGVEYVVHEVKDNAANLSITATNTYKQWDATDLLVHKVDENGDALSGATFTLYSDAALSNVVSTGSTNANGYVEFGPFQSEAVYYLKETTAPVGYQANTKVYTVTVTYTDTFNSAGEYVVTVTELNTGDSFTNDTLTVANHPILGSLTISKDFAIDDADGFTYPAVSFTVTGSNGYSNTVVLDGVVDEVETEAWKATLTGLRYGEYTVSEVTASAEVDGFQLSHTAAQTVTVKDHGDALTTEFTNTYKRQEHIEYSLASFDVKKVDENGNPLAGATFVLTSGSTVIASKTTDANGIATFENLPMITKDYIFGDYVDDSDLESVLYQLTEADAPAGYAADGTVWTVELGETYVKLNEYNGDKNWFETIIDWVGGVFNGEANELEDGVLTVVNTEILGNIFIAKSFSFDTAPANLNDVTVQLHVCGPVTWADEDKTVVSGLGTVRVIDLTAGGSWDEVISGLELGDYIIREVSSSIHGYHQTGVAYTGVRAETAEYVHNGVSYTFQVVTVKESDDAEVAAPVNVTVTNTYEQWDAAGFSIHKVDNLGSDVADAGFTVYTDAACTNVYAADISSPAGYIHFNGFTVPKGETMVTYYLKETGTPAGYYAIDTVWKVKVWDLGDGYEITITDMDDNAAAGFNATNNVLTVENEKIYAELTISKAFKDIQLPADYAYTEILVGVTGPNGAYYTVELNDSNDWTAKLTGLELGTYYVNEKIDTAYITGYNLVSVSYKTDGVTGNTAVFTDSDNSASTVITNDYDLILRDVEVSKVWNDNDDQDGKRPYAIVLELYRNGSATGNTLVITEDDNWEGAFTGLQKYVSGLEISYSVVEDGSYLTEEDYNNGKLTTVAESPYSVTHDIVDGVYVVTNSYTPGLVNVNVQKNWNDDHDRAGMRPQSIEVTLYTVTYDTDGKEILTSTGLTQTMSKENEWDVDFVGLDEYKDGALIEYRVLESETCVDANGNTVTLESLGYQQTAGSLNWDTYIYSITNSRDVEYTDIAVEKTWNDANDQDGIRPYGVVVGLYANGILCTVGGEPVTLTMTEDNGWTTGYEAEYGSKLFKHYEGKEVQYSFKEIGYYADEAAYTAGTMTAGVAEGYKVAISGSTAAGYIVANTHTPEKINIDVFKIWVDNNDQDGKRPDFITVKLLADGTEVASANIYPDANGDWYYTFQNLDKFKDGQEIVYTVEEVPVNGYVPSVEDFIITNTHEIEKTSVDVTKIWQDNNDQDGKRPGSITVNLLADGVKVDSAEVDASTGWTYTFADLDKYANGEEITYTVTEDAVAGYTTTINGFEITNTHEIEKTSVSGTKLWVDNDDQDGKRPASITVNLLADGVKVKSATVTPDAEGNWTYTFANLDKYANGSEIVYTVTEDAVAGYTATINGYTITNTHEIEKTSVPVTKTWVDADDQDGKRPEFITVNLLADGVVVATKDILDTDNWAYTFSDLDAYKDGVKIVYTIEEITIPGYTTVIDGYAITNTHVPETTGLSVTKVWNDHDDNDHKRPASIVVHLLANGEHMGAEYKRQLSAATGWTASWSDLPMYEEGKVINYTVYEDAGSLPAGYTPSYDRDANGNVVITNTYDPEKTAVTVQKVWSDANNQDDIRPASITVKLLADGVDTGKTLVLNADNHWRGTFADLLVKNSGAVVTYTVEEIGVPADYTSTTRIDPYTGIIEIVNTHVPYTTSVDVQKIWVDNNNQDGLVKSDTVVTVALYRNGEDTGKTIELTAANGWKGSFTDLPVHHGIGVDNHYTVVEKNVPAGYTSVITGDAANGFVITNTHEVEKTEITVTKTWNDANNQDGIRPASITVKLLADGVVIKTKEIGAADGWAYTWENLDVYKDGKKIVYTVDEADVAGYTKSIDGFAITNSRTPDLTALTFEKKWEDNDNQDGIRPDSITVNLLADGVVIQTVDVKASNNWKYTFTDLPVNANGKAIVYTVTEEAVKGYTGETNGMTITNTHEVEKTEITVTKIWEDNNNQDGIRPTNVTVNLFADKVLVQTVLVEAADGWKYTFTDLPKFADGEEIEYTVTENEVKGYTASVNGFEITNTHEVEKTEVPVTKQWKDEDDQDGIRPESITVNLLANGIKVDTKTVTAESGWAYTFADLDKYQNGKLVLYTVTEEAVEGYTTEINGFEITNTHVPELTEVTVTKIWSDDDNRDGKRPESITVNLLADGVEIDETVVTADAEGNWKHTFTELDKFAAGEEIVYTVTEDEVIDYITSVDGFEITNTHKPATTDIVVTKNWDDENNNDGKRPASITVNLKVGEDVIATAEIKPDDSGHWSYTFEDLYIFENGEQIQYTVEEVAVPGYTPDYSGDDYTIQITNGYVTEKTSITVNKVWDDKDDQDGIRPEHVQVTLYRGDVVHESVILHEDNDWSYVWTDLYVYSNGLKIDWNIVEAPVDGYKATYGWNNAGTACTVTNTHEVEMLVTEITKIWRDNADSGKIRPYSIDAQLYKNGEAYGEKITLSEGNDWTYEVTLPVYENGEKIEWTVKEVKVPTGYSVGYDQDTLTIFNTIKSSGETPKTGDESNIWMWTGMLGTSAVALMALLLIGKKKKTGAYEA